MDLSRSSYQQSIERMQQSIDRLDRELDRSRQLQSHDITIDNRTKQDLNFIIKVQEQNEANTMNKSQSRVHIPYQSTYRHRVSTTPRERQNSEYTYTDSKVKERPYFKNIDTSNFEDNQFNSHRYQTMTPKQHTTSIKVERKFQPFNRMGDSKQLNYEPFNTLDSIKKHNHLTDSGIQTDSFQITQARMPESKASERIGDEGGINYLPPDLRAQKNQGNRSLEHTETVNLPVLLSEIKNEEKNLGNYPYVSESPQVMNYLKQQYTHHHPELYTPLNKTEESQDMNMSFSSIIKSKGSLNKKGEKDWNIQPLSVGYQNNKKYFDQVKEREMLNKVKIKASQRQERLSSSSRDRWRGPSSKGNDKFQYIGKFELPSGKKEKANDLFLERKSLFMKNLQKNNEKEKKTDHKVRVSDHSCHKNHSMSSNSLSATYKKQPMNRSNSKQMSDRVKDISERLYSRSKDKLHPCGYYQRHGESIERERFYGIVHQNSFVQKYVSKQEQEDLFQHLRREDDSVSSWPMKILNYTYSKLQKINSSRYTIKKVCQ